MTRPNLSQEPHLLCEEGDEEEADREEDEEEAEEEEHAKTTHTNPMQQQRLHNEQQASHRMSFTSSIVLVINKSIHKSSFQH